MSSDFQIINSISKVSLSKHGIIQASAGTGKTYTLSRIYLRVLFEKNISPEYITVLTFTEAAANELKETILNLLSKIHQELLLEKFTLLSSFTILKEISSKQLSLILEKIHLAPIQTIHSFCLSHLKENFFDWKFALNHTVSNFKEQTEYLLQKSIQESFQSKPILLKYWFHIQKLNKTISNKEVKSIKKVSSFQNELLRFFETNTLSKDFFKDGFNIKLTDNTFSNELKEYYQLISKICETVLPIFLDKIKEYKQVNKIYNYSDMIFDLEEKVLNNKLMLSQSLIEKTKYIFFDEFQDTDFSQWNIIQQLIKRSPKEHVIFTIGDPKQLIYEFRGISIHQYLASTDILQKIGSNSYSLLTNYRSSPEMISGLNIFFQQLKDQKEIWFRHLNFQPVNFSKHNMGRIFLNSKKKPPIQVISKYTNSKEKNTLIQKSEYLNYCVDEIKRLLQSGKDEVNNKNIKYQDITCLVRTNTEKEQLLELFQKNDIPVATQDKVSLSQIQVLQLFRNILYFLHSPYEKKFQLLILTSVFFSISLKDVLSKSQNYQDILMSHPISHWKLLVESQKWEKLFYSLLWDSNMITLQLKDPLFFKEAQTIIFQIITYIKVKTFSLLQLCHLLDSWILKEEHIEEINYLHASFYDIQQATYHEEQNDAVRILTIHKSKGLEFNIVFIVGGFSQESVKNLLLIGEDSDKQYLTTHNKNIAEQKKSESEQNLIYVALTRAKYLLYLPYYTKKNKDQTISATTGILGKKLYETLDLLIKSPKGLPKEYELVSYSPTENILNHSPKKTSKDRVIGKIKNFEKINSKILRHQEKTRFVYSFSSLSLSINSKKNMDKPLDESHNIKNNFNESIDFLLEPSATTGNFLHKLLEIITFSDFHELTLDRIENLLKTKYLYVLKSIQEQFPLRFSNEVELNKKYSSDEIEKKRLYLVAIILQNVLQKKIDTLNDTFSLSMLNSSCLIKELEFFSYLQDDKSKLKQSFGKITNLNSIKIIEEKYLTGSLDLAFKYNDKYYFLDYKSNYLPEYSLDFLQKHVEKNYKLQVEIYTSIFHQWIQEREKNYSYENNFGGSIFLYLRGINLTNNNQDGICFLNPKTLFYLI